jgi:hypothetical protein
MTANLPALLLRKADRIHKMHNTLRGPAIPGNANLLRISIMDVDCAFWDSVSKSCLKIESCPALNPGCRRKPKAMSYSPDTSSIISRSLKSNLNAEPAC